MRPGDMDQIDEDHVEMAIAKSLFFISAMCASFLAGIACAYFIWGV